MSLRVWLPLNGNTNNQGLSSITISGSPNSYIATGKIGKCASFAGNTANIIYYNTSEFNYTDNFSYCVWINQNFTGTSQQWAFANGRADYGSYGYGIKINSATDISCFFGSKGVGVSCPTNEWHHIAVTISGNVMKVYKDGILDSTNPTATLPTYSDGNGLGLGCIHYTGGNIFPFYGSLNDFRIYDHCLSTKEVKEISKGLCLHYKLDGVCNTIDSTEWDCSGFNYNGTNSNITIESISSRYSSSYNYSTNDSTTNVAPCFSSGQTQNELTTSIWFKTDTLNSTKPNLISLGEDSFWRFRLASATSIWAYIRVGSTQVATTLTVPSSITSSLIDNKWHLCAVSFKNGIITIYIDGISIGTYNASSTAEYITCGASGSTWHLAGYTSTSESFIGNLSDFRIYSTALSDSDILELYNSPINIDNKGNLYAYEFIEEEENNFSKQGIAKNSEFIDLDTAGDSYTNAGISSTVDYANIFIEK